MGHVAAFKQWNVQNAVKTVAVQPFFHQSSDGSLIF